MNKISRIIAAALLLAASSVVSAEDGGAFDAGNFSATLTFTSDYTFRGTTFSDGDPAIQGSFDWGYGSWFAGAWATSTNPTASNGVGGTMEIDYYFGWANSINGIDLMVMPLFYTFPGQDGARDDFTFELWTSAGHGFANVPGSPYVNFEFNWSPEYFDNGDDSLYYRLSTAFSLPNGFGVDFGYGYTDLGDKNDFFFADDPADDLAGDGGGNYGHWDVGVTKSVLGFDFDLRYHDTSSSDETNLGVGFALDSDFVFTVSRSF